MPTGTLPKTAKAKWESVYQSSLDGSCKGDKECAARTAWSVVKQEWKKEGDKWTRKSDVFAEFSMHISKASLSKGVMRWSAVNSDTQYDSYKERMSKELFEDFISRIFNEEDLPEPFRNLACSDYWCGGMPYLSISHYSDQNGSAVPGEVLELFMDGDKLKAKGILFETPLGVSVWRSLRDDKVKPPDEKIRISIGFLDLAHRHGDGEVWHRKSADSICPECLSGKDDKVYVKGYLVHLALTRVPVNKRTEMVLEEKSMTKKTRKEDAESIVGELSEELDVKEKSIKNMAMVELSDSEKEESQEMIAEIEAKAEPKAEPEEEVREEPKVETPELDASETKSQAKSETPTVEKSPEYTMPFGGATSMKDAQKHLATKEEMVHLMDLWSMFSQVAWNIIDSPDVENKKSAFGKAMDEFKSMLASKAMLTFSEAVVTKSDAHPLQPAIDSFLKVVDNATQLNGDTERAQAINPAFQELGQAITGFLAKSDDEPDEQPTAPQDNNIVDEIRKLSQLFSTKMESVDNRLGVLEAQRASVDVRPKIPARKSMSPETVQKATPTQSVSQIKSIVRKSVGLLD